MNDHHTNTEVRQWAAVAQLQGTLIRGNSFVPSYLRPLRNIPYVAWNNFLATAMSACFAQDDKV
uniref:Uncharacterized protein n=1 Tax=Paracidobacterium acidisoli TaxID=2303751 RepID=A0A372IRV1_9BACT